MINIDETNHPSQICCSFTLSCCSILHGDCDWTVYGDRRAGKFAPISFDAHEFAILCGHLKQLTNVNIAYLPLPLI